VKNRALALLLTLPLWACASSDPATQRTTSIIETPFRLAFTVPTCLGYIVTLAPSALASAAVPFEASKEGSDGDYYKTRTNQACGGPYVAAGTPLW
jgi:hypothetical protein